MKHNGHIISGSRDVGFSIGDDIPRGHLGCTEISNAARKVLGKDYQIENPRNIQRKVRMIQRIAGGQCDKETAKAVMADPAYQSAREEYERIFGKVVLPK